MSNQDKNDDVEVSRRKFLKWSAYVPPTLMGIFASSSVAQAATCNPNACSPDCNPNADCGPDNTCGPDSDDGGGCNPPSNCGPNK